MFRRPFVSGASKVLSRHSRLPPPWLSSATTSIASSHHFHEIPTAGLSSAARRYNTLDHGTNTEPTRPYQKSAVHFLEQLDNDRIPRALVCLKVEEMLLKCLTQEDNVPMDGPLSLNLLNAALRNANLPNERLIPRIFSLACQVMVRSGHPLAPKEAHRQLWNLLDGHKDYLTKDLPYNTHHVNDACKQWIDHVVLESNKKKRRLDYETTQQLSRSMNRMQQLYDDPSVPLVTSADSCNTFIMYFCNQQKPREAYRLLQWMVNESQNKHPVQLVPRASSFTATISAFAKSGQPEMAMEIIQWMLSSYKTKEGVMPPPNWSCLNGLLDAWARSGRKDAGEKAEQTIEWMQQLHETENLDTQPNHVSYAICINAWARSPRPDAPLRAESTLQRMLELYKSGNQVAPLEPAFTSVMNAWANSNRDDAPAKVASILGLMKEMSATTNQLKITAIPYTVLIKAWEQVARQSKGYKKRECGDKALQVLTDMENDGVACTAGTYNALIMALLETSPADAVFYFLELEEKFREGSGVVLMDTRTFNCGLNALTALNKPDAADKAMNILQRMFEYSRDEPSVRPDETTFNIILKVLSRSHANDAALKANTLLIEMDSMPSVKPSSISYLTCIIAWGRSNKTDKFHRVKELLFRFKEAHAKGKLTGRITVSVYNSALSVCYHNTSPELQDDAWLTALTTMEELRKMKRMHPDHTTYLSLFRVMGMLLGHDHDRENRDNILQQEFAHCIHDGLVSREILEMVYMVSPRIFHHFFGESEKPKTVTIPANWSTKALEDYRT